MRRGEIDSAELSYSKVNNSRGPLSDSDRGCLSSTLVYLSISHVPMQTQIYPCISILYVRLFCVRESKKHAAPSLCWAALPLRSLLYSASVMACLWGSVACGWIKIWHHALFCQRPLEFWWMLGVGKMDDRWPANGIAGGHIDSLGKVLYDIWSIILGCRCSHENGSQKPKSEKDVKKITSWTNNNFDYSYSTFLWIVAATLQESKRRLYAAKN